MTFSEYKDLFPAILHSDAPKAPYDHPDYFNYVKLNESRQKRWLKHGILLEETKKVVASITEKQHWIVISEPWCGDASHIVPFIAMMAELNPLIELTIELRDSEPFSIQNYLTDGGKAIPKLIVRDMQGNDKFVWGPRPTDAQQLHHELKESNADFETVKITLQNWYNENKGVDIQNEICQLLA